MGMFENIYVDEIIALKKKVKRLEELEKFIRKVARIPLMDIEIMCEYNRTEMGRVLGPKLKGLVREAKVLTGKTKKERRTL